ncbi:histidinol-phosphate transaminase [Planomicrobium sp. YIM 101495]|uniref:histidinol-phosphate transaminase n=1 Tax=Planomicrobium sp. YIM 101495 TaxID=2665160 RepID=UPI0012BA0A44|nr:histidinol-phosphate transaminase [Planomicrobium sp. YIM 101495]MTD31330.1 histidinol-phosphate transaminase [Planomicrobium sp. YIM 101495]
MENNHINPRKTLETIQPYSPGKPIWEVQEELGLDRVIKLASNENPLGPSPKAVAAIQDGLADLNRYPDADASHLKTAIAAQYGVTKEQVITTNGADELITLISETFLDPGDEIVVPSPSFSEYDFGAHIMGAAVVPVPFSTDFEYDIDALIAAVTGNTKIVYLCSPNNPTGTYLKKAEVARLLDALPAHVLVVFDGAYSQYADAEDYTNGVEFVQAGYPVVALQTFSKIYGIAGVRVGYGLASKSIISSILKVKEPFNVNSLAQIAAAAAIEDTEHVQNSYTANRDGREWFYSKFEELGLSYTKTMANFILVEVGSDGERIYDELMKKGIIVRYGKTWGLPQHVRVTIGTPEENAYFIEVLGSLLASRV